MPATRKKPKKTPAKKSAKPARSKPLALKNAKVKKLKLLAEMIGDDYYPKRLVQKGQRLLLELARQIERKAPVGEAVYALTHATTEAFNELAEEFDEADSEIETVARESIAASVEAILKAYGYEVDLEEAIAPRDW